MKKLIFIFSIVLMAACAGLGLMAAYNYDGYCFENKKYMSPEERKHALVEHIIKTYPPAIMKTTVAGGFAFNPPSKPVRYASVEDFLAENKSCCQIVAIRDETEGAPSFLEKITGTVRDYVKVSYDVKFLDEEGRQKNIKQITSFAMSNCGNPRKKWIPGDSIFGFNY